MIIKMGNNTFNIEKIIVQHIGFGYADNLGPGEFILLMIISNYTLCVIYTFT